MNVHNMSGWICYNNKKKPFGVIHDLYKMKRSHWLLCFGKEL